MKLLIVALLLMTTSAEAGITKWANISCSEGISTRDHKTFFWIHQDDTKTKCTIFNRIGSVQGLTCDDGNAPIMTFEPDGHISLNGVEMWDPSDDRNGICD